MVNGKVVQKYVGYLGNLPGQRMRLPIGVENFPKASIE